MGNYLTSMIWKSNNEDLIINELFDEMKQFLEDNPNEDLVIGLKNSEYYNMHLWNSIQKHETEISEMIVQYGRIFDKQNRSIKGVLITNSFTVWRF